MKEDMESSFEFSHGAQGLRIHNYSEQASVLEHSLESHLQQIGGEKLSFLRRCESPKSPAFAAEDILKLKKYI